MDKWHGSRTKAALQPTWKQLIRVLLAARGANTGIEAIRAYQTTEWGKANGETCVIELSGLPAKALKDGVALRERYFTANEVEQILEERIRLIRRKLLETRPQFVLMYGMAGKPHFERLAGNALARDQVVTDGATKMVLTQHPVAQGSTNVYWEDLGRRLR